MRGMRDKCLHANPTLEVDIGPKVPRRIAPQSAFARDTVLINTCTVHDIYHR